MEEIQLQKGRFYLFEGIPFSHGIIWNTKAVHFPVANTFELTRSIKHSDHINVPQNIEWEFEWKGTSFAAPRLQFILRQTEKGPCLFLIKNTVGFVLAHELDAQRTLINRIHTDPPLASNNKIDLIPLNF